MQKTLIPGNRYDGMEATKPPPMVIQKPRHPIDDKRVAARALYDFHAQHARYIRVQFFLSLSPFSSLQFGHKYDIFLAGLIGVNG